MLTKKLLIATITVLILAAFALWGPDLIQGRVTNSIKAKKAELTTAIQTKNQSIAAIPEPEEDSAVKLAQLEQELQEANQAVPDAMDSTYVINSVLELAVSCNVTATPLQTNDWSNAKDRYMVYNLQIRAEGRYENVAEFIKRLETELFENLTITSVELSGGLYKDTAKDSAFIQLALYIRK